MTRAALFSMSAVFVLVLGTLALGQPGGPVTYEVVINGESFRVEGNRPVKVQSKEKPGTTYEIAVYISPTQQVRLNSVRLDYDMPAKVFDDRGRDQRILQIKHELGFTVTLTDLGRPLDAKGQEEALRVLSDFVVGQARQQKGEDIKVLPLQERKFEGATARGAKVRYGDPRGFGRSSLAYLLTGEKFAVTCVIDYRDADEKDVLPLVKKTLDSIQAIP